MSDNNSIGVISSIWRLVTFYKLRKALGIARAADRQFTGSAAGIADAAEIERINLVNDYNELLEAVSGVENAIQMKRDQRIAVEKSLAESKAALAGAVRLYTAEKAKGDQSNETILAKHKANGVTFQADVDRLTKQITTLDQEIKDNEPQLTQLEGRLTAMQKRIRDLPAEKAKKIAQFISNQAIIDANEKLNNLKTARDRSPMDAVDEALAQQAAKAKVTSRIAGTDSDTIRDQYLSAGSEANAADSFDALVSAHEAKKAEKTGDAPVQAGGERDKI
jgi:chromosome segregation ATPase